RGDHHNHRHVDIRKQVNTQPVEGEQADNHNSRHHHGGENRMRNADTGQKHRLRPPDTTKLVSGCTSGKGATTTRSPASSPSEISISPGVPSGCPVVTSCLTSRPAS